jgi:hypothetical protein
MDERLSVRTAVRLNIALLAFPVPGWITLETDSSLASSEGLTEVCSKEFAPA